MSRFKAALMLGLCLSLAGAMALVAQEPAAEPIDPARLKAIEELEQKLGFRSIDPFTGKAETEKERMSRLATSEDPGADPDPEKVFFRNGQEMTIQKFPKSGAKYDQPPGLVRPLAYINIGREIYREDEENVWVWMFRPGAALGQEPVPAASEPKYRVPEQAEMDLLRKMRPEFEPIEVPLSGRTLKFVESSNGLPQEGSWRNSLAIADMNGDGHLDLVLPPQRGVDNLAHIFLGDGKGNWEYWEDADFDIPLDYGSVAVGDLNGDGHMDAVFGVHLSGVRVFLHDGKGKFVSQGIEGLPETFYTRKAVLHDMNGDGRLDIVAISEGPMMSMGGERSGPESPARLQVFLNEKNGTSWKPVLLGHRFSEVGGDWLKVANLNGDRYPDVAASSIYYSGPDVLWMGKKGPEWEVTGRADVMPLNSLYFAVEAGKFSSKKTDDAIFSFGRGWPREIDPEVIPPVAHDRMVGLERVSWVKGKPVRTPIVRWPGTRAIFSMGSGDLDGDGNLDLIYATFEPREATILLGDGKGGFSKATVEGLELPNNTNYEIAVADVDGDGRNDLIMMFEARTRTDGSVRVWLNRSE
jgi:hypothetical protein